MTDSSIEILTLPNMPSTLSAAIGRQLPNADLEDIEDIAHAFLLTPLLELSDPTIERKALLSIADQAERIKIALGQLGPDCRDELTKALKATVGITFKKVRSACRILATETPGMAERTVVELGRPATAKRHLVLELAASLNRSGYEVNSKPQGALVYLTSEILTWLLGSPGDVRSTVRNALKG